MFLGTSLLDPVIFSHDTTLFVSHQNINELLRVVDSQLEYACDRFNSSKLSLNERKTKYILFYRHRDRGDIPLKLPPLFINKKQINGVSLLKFLDVMFGENLNCNEYLNTTENKISKNIRILSKAKEIINANRLRSLYYSLIHTFFNYRNLSSASTRKTNLKKIALR